MNRLLTTRHVELGLLPRLDLADLEGQAGALVEQIEDLVVDRVDTIAQFFQFFLGHGSLPPVGWLENVAHKGD